MTLHVIYKLHSYAERVVPMRTKERGNKKKGMGRRAHERKREKGTLSAIIFPPWSVDDHVFPRIVLFQRYPFSHSLSYISLAHTRLAVHAGY